MDITFIFIAQKKKDKTAVEKLCTGEKELHDLLTQRQ